MLIAFICTNNQSLLGAFFNDIKMKPSEIKKLKCGDKVWWIDPDELCSRFYTIKRLKITNGTVLIQEPDGSVLQCPTYELSVKKP